jgi:hypothetical protein
VRPPRPPRRADCRHALTPPAPPSPRAAQRVGTPPLKKEVTAELGNVTPYLIVPGPWSDADIAFHAASVAAGLAQNNGHNCLSAEVGASGLGGSGRGGQRRRCLPRPLMQMPFATARRPLPPSPPLPPTPHAPPPAHPRPPRSSSPRATGRCARASWTPCARASTPSASARRGTPAARPSVRASGPSSRRWAGTFVGGGKFTPGPRSLPLLPRPRPENLHLLALLHRAEAAAARARPAPSRPRRWASRCPRTQPTAAACRLTPGCLRRVRPRLGGRAGLGTSSPLPPPLKASCHLPAAARPRLPSPVPPKNPHPTPAHPTPQASRPSRRRRRRRTGAA